MIEELYNKYLEINEKWELANEKWSSLFIKNVTDEKTKQIGEECNIIDDERESIIEQIRIKLRKKIHKLSNGRYLYCNGNNLIELETTNESD